MTDPTSTGPGSAPAVGGDSASNTSASNSNSSEDVTFVVDNTPSVISSNAAADPNSHQPNDNGSTQIPGNSPDDVEWSDADLDAIAVVEGTADSDREVEYAPTQQERLDEAISDVPLVDDGNSQLEAEFETLETFELPAINYDTIDVPTPVISPTMTTGTFAQTFEATDDVEFTGRSINSTIAESEVPKTDVTDGEEQRDPSSFFEQAKPTEFHEEIVESVSEVNNNIGFLAQMWGALRGLGQRNQKTDTKRK